MLSRYMDHVMNRGLKNKPTGYPQNRYCRYSEVDTGMLIQLEKGIHFPTRLHRGRHDIHISEQTVAG
jgi:hypothetical protein